MKSPIQSVYAIPGIIRGAFSERDLVRVVCDFYGADSNMLDQKTRKREVVLPRQVCMYFIREMFPNLTFENIGFIFKKDHATVMHAIKVMKDLMDTDKAFMVEVDVLRKDIMRIIDERKEEPKPIEKT